MPTTGLPPVSVHSPRVVVDATKLDCGSGGGGGGGGGCATCGRISVDISVVINSLLTSTAALLLQLVKRLVKSRSGSLAHLCVYDTVCAGHLCWKR